jgi:hypothetical protein
LAARWAGENWIMNDNIFRAIWIGLMALLALLGVYFGLLTLVSGWQFTLDQFAL